MLWKKFNALGSEIVISTTLEADQEQILDQVERKVIEFEQKFSRFVKTSELEVFNNFSGTEFEASEQFIKILTEAKKYFQITQGIFDPTIIGSLEGVGYSQNFTELKLAENNSAQPDLEKIKVNFLNRPKFSELQIINQKIIKPKGFRLDLGGLGKGYVSDWLSQTLLAELPNYWFSAGGDLLAKGSDQDQVGWKIGVQNPSEPEKQILTFQTKGEKLGVATSGVFKRMGRQGSFVWHHLIDPRTGLPVDNNILAVTALAPSASSADVFAKTVLILGEVEGLRFIEAQRDSACIIFYKSGGFKFSERATKYFYHYEANI